MREVRVKGRGESRWERGERGEPSHPWNVSTVDVLWMCDVHQ